MKRQLEITVLCCLVTLFVALLFMFSSCGNVSWQTASETVTVERAVLPQCAVPGFDASRFGNKVYVDFSANGVAVSALPAGVTIENGGRDVLLRSRVPGVEYVVSGDAVDASFTIVSDFSPLLTLDSLSLVACGRNTLQVSSKELIYVRSGAAALSDVTGGEKADNQSAVIKLMGRAMLCEGSLEVNAARRSAIFCTDTLFVDGMQLTVGSAPNNALLSNRSIVLSAGSVSVSSAKDVVKCKNGDFLMTGGVLAVTSSHNKADGIQAKNIYITGGCLSVMVSGAASDGMKAKSRLCIAGGNLSVVAKGCALFNDKKSDYSSASCLKSDAVVDISGGCCSFVSEGDGGKGISSDSLVVVSGGLLSVLTKGGDMQHPVDVNAHSSSKGIKSDGALYFLGGDIEVAALGKGERSEGVEAKCNMYIGGTAKLYVYAYDDALNAADLTVAGGHSYFYSVANDAVDSNGSILLSGGTVIAEGACAPEQGVDVDDFSAFSITGGALFSVGGSMGPFPALPLSAESSVPVVAWQCGKVKKGDMLSLSNEDGTLIMAYRMARDMEAASVLVASPQLRKDGEYALAISGALSGAEYAGNGMYKGGKVVDAMQSVLFEPLGLVNCVSKDGEVTVAGSGSAGSLGVPPPPPHASDGSIPPHGAFPPPRIGNGPMPPHGVFPPPPPPMRNIESGYGEGNLPNSD